MEVMEQLDDLVLRHITSFLDPEDIVRLGRTSRRMYSLMPRVILTTELWKGNDFHMSGPWEPELYFDGPLLPSTVQELNMDVVWQDQGHGNRKGELYMILMRPAVEGEPVQIAEYRRLFGIAEHYEEQANKVIPADHPVVAEAKPGDFYRFMRNAGGGGGHELTVKNFRVEASTRTVMYKGASELYGESLEF
ncbi:hypothetical protein OS493_010746 [Desmophyllum pertusum]|uniref:F-box domain-containing protein n=1 Tax=Desmophyllum pertusum TaxID=174260 RepID=A0A9X0D081_9CNID|nr:hypothetical protein OS493_010746 [Desmophyllum pertusum]